MYLRSRLPVKKLRHLLHRRRKVRVFLWKGIWKNIISYYTSAFLINPQPRRRSLLSNKSVLLIYVLSLPVLLIHVLLLPSMFYQSSPVHVLWHACHNWFPREMTSEKWTQKLMTCHYPDLGSEHGISALISRTSFRGGMAKSSWRTRHDDFKMFLDN